jgi:hypothetical protein
LQEAGLAGIPGQVSGALGVPKTGPAGCTGEASVNGKVHCGYGGALLLNRIGGSEASAEIEPFKTAIASKFT